MQLMYNK